MYCIKKYPFSIISYRRVCNLSDPKTTSGEQFQNDLLWVRGFTGFNVDGTQIHMKKNMQFQKKNSESCGWGLTSSSHKELGARDFPELL